MTHDHHSPRYVLARLREVDSCDYEGHALLSDGPHEESSKFYVRRECVVDLTAESASDRCRRRVDELERENAELRGENAHLRTFTSMEVWEP